MSSQQFNTLEAKKNADKGIVLLFVIVVFLSLLGAVFAGILNKQRSITPVTQSTQDDRINKLEKEVKQLTNEVNTYTNTFNATPSANIDKIASRVTELESKEKALSETILIDPDKAVTASVLREKQQEVASSISDLKQSVYDVNKKIDDLESSMINLLIGGFVLVLAVSIILGIIRFLVIPYNPWNKQKSDKTG